MITEAKRALIQELKEIDKKIFLIKAGETEIVRFDDRKKAISKLNRLYKATEKKFINS